MTQEQAARQVLADLKDQLAALELHRAELEDLRDQHSYDAFTGDASAKAALGKATKALVDHGLQIDAMQAAIREAEARVLQAQGIAREQLEHQRAEAALKHGQAMLDALKAAEKAFSDGFSALADAHAEVVQLGRLGCPPSQSLFETNTRRSLISTSMYSRFSLGHLSPPERHTLSELGGAWGRNVEAWAAQRLGEPKKEAA